MANSLLCKLPLLFMFITFFASPRILAAKLQNGTMIVDERGTKLFYTDTGAPSRNSTYTTIFGVHGMAFNSGVFVPTQAVAQTANIRFVGINRRNYLDSTPYSDAELQIINNGTEAQKNDFLKARGVELLTFMDNFIQMNNISAMGADAMNSGVVVLGWSLGSSVTISAIANVDAVSPAVRARLASRIHTFIMHEPGSNILGLPIAPRAYVPWNLFDPAITLDSEMPVFAEWIAGYFQHGDLTTRNPDVLTYITHAFFRPPTVYPITRAGYDFVIEAGRSTAVDIPYQLNFAPQLAASYQKANYDKANRQLLPNMRNFYLGGEHSPQFGPFTVWLVQDDDTAHGGGFVRTKIIDDINHISPWDDPEKTLRAYQDCIRRAI